MSLEERNKELEAEVRRLYVMLQSAPDFVVRVSVDGKVLYINRLAPGFKMEDVVGTSIDNYVLEPFRERAHAAIREACATRSVQQYATVGLVSADRMGHYLTRVSPVVEDGEVTSLVMASTDVTELEEQRTLLQLALDSGKLGIWTFNPNLKCGTWDETTRQIFGLGEGEPPPNLPEMLSEHIHPADRERVFATLQASHASGTFGPIEHRILRPNGEMRWISAAGLTVRDLSGGVAQLVGSMQDITARKLMEARLVEAQKLESIGRLAGGVAHDFNNMLTAILGNVDFAKESDSLSEIQPMLDDIRVTAERSAALTAQLLAFARRQVIEPKVIDPNVLIRRLDTVFRGSMGERVRTLLVLGAAGRVRADESQLEQVIMNLVTNARDAMADGGVVTVETTDVEIADGEHGSLPGGYVLIAVADTGQGIAPDALPRVFEPFYTTRSLGTGLGLATCYGIVKQGGGHIAVESELGRGATFKVYLPRSDGELSGEVKARTLPPEAAGERVLLIEDEEPVRRVVERTLKNQGYHVVSASSAEQARELMLREPHFEVLVTDVVLPGMGGRQFAEELLQREPKLRVLYISGYTEGAVEREGVLDQGLHFLQKPFVPNELLRAVRKVLVA